MEGENEILLLVGLGNPGRKYEQTRHNIGFMLLDVVAEEYGLSFQNKDRFEAQFVKFEHKGKTIVLLKPTTYMNLSGLAVKKCMQFFKIKREHLLVVSDDVALDFEQMRIRPKGGHGGHNGLKNIQSHVGPDFARLRLGVSEPSSRQPLEDYVLEKFSKKELSQMGAYLADALYAVELWISQGLEKAMNVVNEKNN